MELHVAPRHGPASIPGRAALARVLARLEPAEWPAAAAALGFEPLPVRPRVPSAKLELRRAPDGATDTKAASGATETPPATYRPSDLPDLPFWRIAAVEHQTPDPDGRRVPRWLATAKPWDALPQARRDQVIPRPPPLSPAPRQARFLRQALAHRRPGRALDLERLCTCLANCRLPERLPRQRRPRWPGRVHLVLDLSPALRPFHAELWAWAERLEQALGERVLRLVTPSGSPLDIRRPGSADPGRRPVPLADGTPLVILGDAGLYTPDSPRQRHWLVLADHCRRAGRRPLLLAPLPPRRLTPAAGSQFACALLERGAPLRIARPLRPSAAVGRISAAHPPSSTEDTRDQAAALAPATTGPSPADPATLSLLGALAPGARTEPALLRRLRLLLAGQGADIGTEHAVWSHPDVVTDELACALRPDRREAAEAAFHALPAGTRQAILAARAEHHRQGSPFVRLEEALAAAALASSTPGAALPPGLAPELAEALVAAKRWAATLHRQDHAEQQGPLRAAISGLAHRRPALLAQHPALAVAWGLAKQSALRSGALARLPSGLDPAALRWLLEPGAPERPVVLAQQGEALGLYPADGPGPACVLARGRLAGAYWELEPAPDADAPDIAGALAPEDAPAAQEAAQGLRLGEALRLSPARRWHIGAGDLSWTLEAIRRPRWARGLGRDAEGLFAEPDPSVLPAAAAPSETAADRPRLYWQPAGPLRVQGLDEPLMLRQGAWWGAALYLQVKAAGLRLPAPDWAERQGIDDYGLWAEFSVQGVIQRLRWLPPGDFLMGSPEDEPQRGAGERQHQVLLTLGLWLADTACTQALWRAVLDEDQSGFKGPERPVEQVSWEDIVERFLPVLNQRVPGLDARLPTEAEWEFGCRAGTTTPFSFGETLTTDQANYDGAFPYAGGIKGEARVETVEVKALPANQWGLYQMHGNVYEWCQDWLAEYPAQAVIDPIGSYTGRERVLRGGNWRGGARWCRSAARYAEEPAERSLNLGFRLARGPSPEIGEPASGAGAAGKAAGGPAPAAEHAVPAPRPQVGR